MDDETIAEIRRALLAHRVVFFRDQSLDYDRQVAFAQRLGPLTLGHPTIPSPESQPFLEEIDSAKAAPANRWHTDVTFCDRPPAFTLLHGVVMPEVGGDTIWANTVSAYESLPKELRELADTLRIVHTNTHDYAKPSSREEAANEVISAHRRQFVSKVFRTEHPAVRVHPETGERSLVLGGFAETVVGLGPQASRDLIRILQDYVDAARAHGALALESGRPRHLGQPRHPARRRVRLRQGPPPGRAGHRGRACPRRRRWSRVGGARR